jgi:hypothetical protein
MVDTTTKHAAGEVLDSVERVRGTTRTRVRGAWLPLLVFGAVTLASIPLYSRPFAYPSGERAFSAGPYVTPYYAGLPGARSQLVAYLFWLLVAPLGYVACAAWYRRRAGRLGVSFRWERWVAAGLGLFALLQALLAMPLVEPGRRIGNWVATGRPSATVDLRAGAAAFLTPLVAVAIGLLVLAWIERSWVVAAVAVLYGGFTVVVNTYGLGQIPPWIVPPHGGSRDLFVAPAYNLVLLALLLFAASGLCAIRAWRPARAS